MRFIGAILIWVLFIGSVSWFVSHRTLPVLQPIQPDTATSQTVAQDEYALAITLTFQAEPDPFTLQTEDDSADAVLIVRMGSNELLQISKRLNAGQAVRIEKLENVKLGLNEIYIEASPPVSQGNQRHAMLVELFENGNLIQQETFWSAVGGKVTGTFRFTIREHEEAHEH